MQLSSKQIVFKFEPGKHLSANIVMKNIQSFNQLFKFKASTANRFIVKPNVGSVEPGQQCNVEIIIHKEIVQNFENQRIQLLYGKSLEDNKQVRSHMFSIRVQGSTSNLDLTTMVQTKQTRIKQLETQVRDLKMMPSASQKKKKSSKFILKLLLAIIIGLLIGFFGPLRIFKTKIIRKTN